MVKKIQNPPEQKSDKKKPEKFSGEFQVEALRLDLVNDAVSADKSAKVKVGPIVASVNTTPTDKQISSSIHEFLVTFFFFLVTLL